MFGVNMTYKVPIMGTPFHYIEICKTGSLNYTVVSEECSSMHIMGLVFHYATVFNLTGQSDNHPTW